MKKQKKQMLFSCLIMLMVLICFVIICLIPKNQEEEEKIVYDVTSFDSNQINKLTFTNEAGTFSFRKVGEDWSYEADETLDIDESKIEDMIQKLAKYQSENKITDVTDLISYGLHEPDKKMLISDGENSVTFLVGSYNNITYTYYMCLESAPDTVFTMSSADLSLFDQTIEDLIVETEETSEIQTTDSGNVE